MPLVLVLPGGVGLSDLSDWPGGMGSLVSAEVGGGARVALDAAGALGSLPAFETVKEAVASVEAA